MASLRPLPVFALNRDGSVVSSSVFRGDSSVSSWRGGMLRMGLRGGGAFLLGGLVVKGSTSSTTSSLCSLQGGKVAWGLDLQEVERRVRDGGPEVHRFGVQEESGAACVRLLHPQAVRYVVMCALVAHSRLWIMARLSRWGGCSFFSGSAFFLSRTPCLSLEGLSVSICSFFNFSISASHAQLCP